MAQFSQLITTKQGQILIAKMLSGTNGIKFTRITTSSTRYEIDQLEDLTELSDTKQSVLVSKVSRPSEITVQVEAAIKNDEIVIGYYLRSVGLYAIDPDVGEVLFAVTIETSGNCYMPAYNGVAVSGAYIKLVARVSNSEIVNLEVDPAASATVGDIMNKLDFDSDISETVICNLETIDTKYPIPVAGETVKVFLGKVTKFINDYKDNLKVREVVLIAAGWDDRSVPYTQTVDVPGATADLEPILVSALEDGASIVDQKAYNKAFSIVTSGTAFLEDGTATFKVYKKPTIDVVVGLKGV